jgi:putative transposase
LIGFIDAHRHRFGVEPICRVLSEHGCKIAPNTYWVARKRPPSKRACGDAELVVEIRRVYAENLFVYGADKVWAQLNRERIRVARCTVERLMRAEGLSGPDVARRSRSRLMPMTVSTARRTSSNDGSGRRRRTACGSPI